MALWMISQQREIFDVVLWERESDRSEIGLRRLAVFLVPERRPCHLAASLLGEMNYSW